jgi:hypothetical protein
MRRTATRISLDDVIDAYNLALTVRSSRRTCDARWTTGFANSGDCSSPPRRRGVPVTCRLSSDHRLLENGADRIG